MVLKLKVTGSYLRNDEPNDYEVTLYMPKCDDDHIQQAAMYRATPMALYRKGMACDYLRSCYVDEIEEVQVTKDTPKEEAEAIKEAESFFGKDIKTLTYEEIQNAAIFYQLTGVPLYHQTDIRESRQRFYYEYATKVLERELEKDFDYANARQITLDENKKAKTRKQKTNSELLDEEEEMSEKK